MRRLSCSICAVRVRQTKRLRLNLLDYASEAISAVWRRFSMRDQLTLELRLLRSVSISQLPIAALQQRWRITRIVVAGAGEIGLLTDPVNATKSGLSLRIDGHEKDAG